MIRRPKPPVGMNKSGNAIQKPTCSHEYRLMEFTGSIATFYCTKCLEIQKKRIGEPYHKTGPIKGLGTVETY